MEDISFDSDWHLMAISPIDGRYANVCQELRQYFSQYGLTSYRITVELKWLELLSESSAIQDCESFDSPAKEIIKKLYKLSFEDVKKIKEIEKVTNHDVKAIEYYIKQQFLDSKNKSLIRNIEFIHFGCTSEDINNLAYSLMLKDAIINSIKPCLFSLIDKTKELAHEYASIPLLSRTHGQPATPTTFGKEISVFTVRLQKLVRKGLNNIEYMGKFNGAVGNFNAHLASYPNVDWIELSRKLIEDSLGLSQQIYSTQIESHDFISELCDSIVRINTCLLDFNMDMWNYISRDLLKLKLKENEVGSSTMPHKINPIDFENSEGNLHLANSILRCLSGKLPISRLQRDLSDSTLLRNLGIGFAHSFLSYKSTIRGLSKVEVNQTKMQDELNEHWSILAEPIQMVFRKSGISSPYEKLKDFTRGKPIDKSSILDFINSFKDQIPPDEFSKLLSLTPNNYIGMAIELARNV